ncbi:hypothetical protein FHETE_6489 [Fusarium heterosporum]|uniref:Uncharacterized protein n=1 Tax=Fusarium heterosporum TaxID=42747 RepID=A0A8H5TAX6_FUSHE|nr:hypothetical protein FHETE_6489 [Fusarium heterosporum]
MLRLYILLCLLPCLLLTVPFTHGALLPRLEAPFKLPGISFTEPVAGSIKVVPFKELPSKPHSSHGLRHTISLVKRLVEDQGEMVEVTEDSLQELLDQISKLKEQVDAMMPSGESDRQPSAESGASSEGQSGQLPAGSPDGSSEGDRPEQSSVPSVQAGTSKLKALPGPSEVPVVLDPSERPPFPSKADEAAVTAIDTEDSGASGQVDVPVQLQTKEPNRKENTELAVLSTNPTQVANGESANLPSETQLEGLPSDSAARALAKTPNVTGKDTALQSSDLPNNAIAQQASEGQNPAKTQLSVAPEVEPTEVSQDQDASSQSEEQDAEETSAVPGGVFVEDADDSIGTLSDATSAGQTGSSPSKTQKPSLASDDECVEEKEVSGLPLKRRISNCTPSSSPSTSELSQQSLITLTLIPTPATTGAKKAAPALETEATLTLTTKPGSPTVAGPQLSVSGSSLSLRTLVFTSVLTRSSTIKATTTYTEFVNVSQPTRSLKAPGHVFKEDAEATFNKDGKLAIQDGDENEMIKETPQGTPLPVGTTPVKATSRPTVTSSLRPTTTISLSKAGTFATLEPTQDSWPWSPVSSEPGSTSGALSITPTTGFKTMPRSTASLAERAQK